MIKIRYLIVLLTIIGFSFLYENQEVSKGWGLVSEAPTDTLKVMTYNIHHGNPPSKEKDGTIDLKAIAQTINEQNPDLVALQEVDVNTTRSGKDLNEAKKIGQLTGMYSYFVRAMHYEGGEYGNAILSRFPIQDSIRYQLPNQKGTNDEARALGIIKVTTDNYQTLYFASTHLSYKSSANRLLQAQKISDLVKSISDPLILAGDFNAIPSSPTIRLLDSSWTRSCQERCSATFSSNNPSKKIDYIMYKPANLFEIENFSVISDSYASDHRPVVVTLYNK